MEGVEMIRTGIAAERFWAKVDKCGPDECWPWLASVSRYGYGHFTVRGIGTFRSHRLAYELLVGPIPEGLTLDHLCHSRDKTCEGSATCLHRRCINPAHLEPVTIRENSRRGYPATKAFCINGHAFTAENTVWTQEGWRKCHICYLNSSLASQRRSRVRARAALALDTP